MFGLAFVFELATASVFVFAFGVLVLVGVCERV